MRAAHRIFAAKLKYLRSYGSALALIEVERCVAWSASEHGGLLLKMLSRLCLRWGGFL
jgi:hypothetical protein